MKRKIAFWTFYVAFILAVSASMCYLIWTVAVMAVTDNG